MSNYQGGNGPYPEGTGASGEPFEEGQQGGPSGYPGGPGQPGGNPAQHDTSQFQGGGHQSWEGGGGYQGGQQGHPGQQGFFQGGNPMSSRGHNPVSIRSTFKTTEFWVLLVVSVALLIAAAVTDQGADNQGFGAQEAWKYVTWLSVAYILSRGLTKFSGNEPHRGHGQGHGSR